MERKVYLRRSGESRPPRLVHGCFREEILEAITEPAGRYVRGKSVHAGSDVVPTESSREQHVALSGLGVSEATVTGAHHIKPKLSSGSATGRRLANPLIGLIPVRMLTRAAQPSVP
jgi:hypothetical protein